MRHLNKRLSIFLIVGLAVAALITALSFAQEDKTALICCGGKKPQFNTAGMPANYSTFNGQVAVVTCWSETAANPVVGVVDLKNQYDPNVPIDTNWSSSSNPQTQFYHHTLWSRQNLGDVFGLTLDNNGNIYVAATRVYGTANVGAVSSFLGKGSVYKLDAVTAVPTEFVKTTNDAVYQFDGRIPNTGPALGNVHYSHFYDNFYVSNFEDGMIYRIGPAGNVIGWWDHGANLSTANPPSANVADSQTAGYTQLDRRPWAVQTFGGRLYYSIWKEDQSRQSATQSNEVWSVALDPSGAFIGSAKREIIVPAISGNYSNPVSDISFGPTGKMMLAERTMTSDSSSYAHSSRTLEYQLVSGLWVPSGINFKIGDYNTKTNSAGGVAYDHGPNGRVWATGDALHFATNDRLYGLQGTPATGGDNTNSILIDLDEDLVSPDKTWIGDVEIPCPEGSYVQAIFSTGIACVGATTTFNNTSLGATTYLWNFGDGTANSTAQNPTHVYAAAGTYNVTLCINGGASCVTHQVTVKPAPAVPVVTGPTNLCAGLNANYSIPTQGGVAYSWGIIGGTINGGQGTNAINVTWGASGGVLMITVSNKGGCSSSVTIQVLPCPVDDCCVNRLADSLPASSFVYQGGGNYLIKPVLTGGAVAKKVTVDVISTAITSASCGTGTGPTNSYVISASNSLPAGFTQSVPVPYSHEAIWSSAGQSLAGGVSFPLNIQLPAPPGFPCSDVVTICIRYTVTDVNCRTCEIIRCYSFKRTGIPNDEHLPNQDSSLNIGDNAKTEVIVKRQ